VPVYVRPFFERLLTLNGFKRCPRSQPSRRTAFPRPPLAIFFHALPLRAPEPVHTCVEGSTICCGSQAGVRGLCACTVLSNDIRVLPRLVCKSGSPLLSLAPLRRLFIVPTVPFHYFSHPSPLLGVPTSTLGDCPEELNQR